MTNYDELVKRLPRYDVVLHHKAGQNPYAFMKEDEEGSYCDFGQVEPVIKDLQRQLAEKDEALREAVEALKGAKTALAPLNNAVFNDNGDIHVTTAHVKYEDCERAYFVSKRIAAIVAKQETKNNAPL